MADCEFLGPCPIFAKFRLEGTKNFWIMKYCKGTGEDQEKCARKILKKQGKTVSPTLLPDGAEMKV